jgi:Domain of unknown function (DUF4440)
MRSLLLTMIRNSLLIMAVLALGFAMPAFAQQNTVDQQTRQQLEGIVVRLAETLSKGDGQGYQALYATNAIEISALKGKSTGQQIGDLEDARKVGLTFTATVDDIEPIFGGQGLVIIAPYAATFTTNPAARPVQGISTLVLERDGGGWKIRIATFSRLRDRS